MFNIKIEKTLYVITIFIELTINVFNQDFIRSAKPIKDLLYLLILSLEHYLSEFFLIIID